MGRWFRILSFTGALLLSFRLSYAGHAPPGLGLRYQATLACPSQEQFVAAVRARGGEFTAGNAERYVEVMLGNKEGGFSGTLRVRGAQGTSKERVVEATHCSEAIDALAVVAAITLRAEQATVPARDGTLAVATTAPPVAKDARKLGRGATTARRLRATGEVGTESVPVTAGTLHFDDAFSLTGSVGTLFGLVPGVLLPRYDLSLTRASFVTTPAGQSYRVGSILRTRFSFHGKGTLRTTDSTTNVSGFSAGIGACLSPLFDTEGWSLLFCTEFAAGKMQLDTEDLTGAPIQSKSIAFATASLGPEIEYNFSRMFHVGLRVGPEATLKELSAERRDGSRIFQSSVIYGVVALGLGVHF